MSNVDLETQNSHLVASDRVEGTTVYNPAGDKLGSIHNFMVDKVSGRVEFVVLKFGGLLGLGSDHYPLPWTMLSYSADQGGYVVDLDKAALVEAPRFGDIRPAYDRDYDDMVRAYYDNRPTPFI